MHRTIISYASLLMGNINTCSFESLMLNVLIEDATLVEYFAIFSNISL
ncbi:hypothetical protein BVRB_2g043090 [Beta vulgaris subsp. vulgaris]|nr:hypothetical protein BVRB_2g043090 [Beta vulgaris subsp. vulgaris]